jgi:hypothetical protein
MRLAPASAIRRDEVAGGEGFSAAHGHVDQGARTVAGERLFEVGDDAVLMVPEAFARQRRHDAQAASQAGAGRFEIGFEPRGERFGTMEAEDRAAARFRFEEICESRLDARGLINERQRAP